MKLKIKSISLKVSLLYIFLAVVNMSFFSLIIYENQIDLITENTKYHVKELTSVMVSYLENFSTEMESKKIFNVKNKKALIDEVAGMIRDKVEKVDDFVIFTEEGGILYKSTPDIGITKTDIRNGIKAVTNMDFTGGQYFSTINEETYEISFYIPFKLYMLEESVLFLKFQMKDIGTRLQDLYRLITLIISIIALFHIIFAVLFFRMFVKPIQSLNMKSIEISKGNLSARADIDKEDEIGQLGRSFNSMADSIQEKITTLQKQKDMMDFELNIAGEVQQVIFPNIEENDFFSCFVFHKAFGKVSGDYYDIFKLDEKKYGFLIVDVSGHGVPAALITMIAKEKFRTFAPYYHDPAELFSHVNSEINDILGADEYSGLYFSAFYVTVDGDKRLSFCNAGHQQSFLIRVGRKKIAALNTDGFLVGVADGSLATYQTKTVTAQSGDKIVLFTDGIVEARNEDKDEYSVDRIIKNMSKYYSLSGEKILNAIVEDLTGFTNIDEMRDDATLIVIEIK